MAPILTAAVVQSAPIVFDAAGTIDIVHGLTGEAARRGATLVVFPEASFPRWENYMPLLRMAMYAKGIELYGAPTLTTARPGLSSMRHVALEGRCFVLTACQHLRRGDCPPDYAAVQGNDPDTVIMRGGSALIGPLGQVLAGPLYNQNGTLVAELDLGDIARANTTSRSPGTTRAPTSSSCTSTRIRPRPSSSIATEIRASVR